MVTYANHVNVMRTTIELLTLVVIMDPYFILDVV